MPGADEDAFGFTGRGKGRVCDGNRKLTQGYYLSLVASIVCNIIHCWDPIRLCWLVNRVTERSLENANYSQ